MNFLTHLILPRISDRRSLGNENEICARRYASHQSEPTAVASHDLHNESSRMGERGRVDVINGLTDTMECG